MLKFVSGFIFGFGCGAVWMGNHLEVEEPVKQACNFAVDDMGKAKDQMAQKVDSIKNKVTFKKTADSVEPVEVVEG
jgi:hypothetical protein